MTRPGGRRLLWAVVWLTAALSVVPLALAFGRDGLPPIATVGPYAVAIAVSEALFVAGLALMGAAAASLAGTALQRFLPRGTRPRRLVMAGFWVNLAGAVGTPCIALLALVRMAPPGAWGLALPLLADLALTAATRAPLLLALRRLTRVEPVQDG